MFGEIYFTDLLWKLNYFEKCIIVGWYLTCSNQFIFKLYFSKSGPSSLLSITVLVEEPEAGVSVRKLSQLNPLS